LIIFLRENIRWLFGGLLLTFCSSFGQTFFIALSGAEIRGEYGLSNGEWGSLYMAATLASAATLPFLGRIVDWISVSRTILIIVPVLAFASFAMGFSQNVLLLAFLLYLLRLFGQGMMTHTALTAMGKWYSSQRGKAVSITVVGHQLGEASLPLIFAVSAGYLGWRGNWIAASAILLILALPALYGLMRVERMPRELSGKVSGTDKDWTSSKVMADPLFWILLTAVLAPPFIGTTLFFHHSYLVELRGWEPEIFALTFTLMAFTTFCVALINGQLIDRFSAVAILPYFLLPLAASCFVAAYFESQISAFIFMGLMGISYGISSTLFGALWPEVYGIRHLGAIRSIIVAVMVFATALGPGATGILIDMGVPYPMQIAAFGVYCLLACLIMGIAKRRIHSRQQQAIEEIDGAPA